MAGSINIKAVYEDDLEPMMKNLGMWNDYCAGKLKCYCGETITEKNLAAFQKIKGKVYPLHTVTCGSPFTL